MPHDPHSLDSLNSFTSRAILIALITATDEYLAFLCTPPPITPEQAFACRLARERLEQVLNRARIVAAREQLAGPKKS